MIRRAFQSETGASTVETIALCGAVILLLFAIRSAFDNGGSTQIQSVVDRGLYTIEQGYDKQGGATSTYNGASFDFHLGE